MKECKWPMSITCKRCTDDEDYAQACLFMLKNRRALHPGFITLDVISWMYSYITEGNLIQLMDADGCMIGVGCYYYGSPEQDYEDKHEVAYVDNVIIVQSLRSTRLFFRGFHYLLTQIEQDHPEISELRFAAQSSNDYLQKLYAKFATKSYTREGS